MIKISAEIHAKSCTFQLNQDFYYDTLLAWLLQFDTDDCNIVLYELCTSLLNFAFICFL